MTHRSTNACFNIVYPGPRRANNWPLPFPENELPDTDGGHLEQNDRIKRKKNWIRGGAEACAITPASGETQFTPQSNTVDFARSKSPDCDAVVTTVWKSVQKSTPTKKCFRSKQYFCSPPFRETHMSSAYDMQYYGAHPTTLRCHSISI